MKTKQSLQGEPGVVQDYKTKVAIIAAILANQRYWNPEITFSTGEQRETREANRIKANAGLITDVVSLARQLLDEVDTQVDAELSETPGKAGL